MYSLPAFRRPEYSLTIMRQAPLALVLSHDDAGAVHAAHLPLHAAVSQQDPTQAHQLLGHCAAANPLWKYLQARPETLICFSGPQAFMPTTVYSDSQRVPTWNYLAVHVRARAEIVSDAQEKDRLLKTLIADHHPAYAQQWRDLPASYTERMLGAIVGLRWTIESCDCVVKLNQHRPEAHAAMHAHYRSGTAPERALAEWMERLGLVGGEGEGKGAST